MKSGIYSIVAPSGGRYVGSAVDLGSRRRMHFHLLRKGKHFNNGLQHACTKYGIPSLEFKPLLICRKGDLLLFEQRAIDILKPRYNACPIAGSQYGRSHSAESRAKMSAVKKGKSYHTAESRAALSARMLGNKLMAGRIVPPEVRAKQSASAKGKRHRDGFETLVTDIQRAEIARAYQDGTGQLMLAAQWKTSHKVIRRILAAAGVEVHPAGHTIKP